MKLEIEHLVCGYRKKTILPDVSFTVESGDFICILGVNGTGKTTLFKTLLGLLPSKGGTVKVDGEDATKWSVKKRAKYFGYIPQFHTPPFPYTALQVVTMGRTGHMSSISSPKDEDVEVALDAMKALNIEYLKDSVYTEISGGERQMVLVARAITQNPKFILMDEPTSNLDFGNQTRVLNEVIKLTEKGIAVIMTTHSPNHVFIDKSKVLMIRDKSGHYSFGRGSDIITESSLTDIYKVPVAIIQEERESNLIKSCVPLMGVMK